MRCECEHRDHFDGPGHPYGADRDTVKLVGPWDVCEGCRDGSEHEDCWQFAAVMSK